MNTKELVFHGINLGTAIMTRFIIPVYDDVKKQKLTV